MCAHEFQVYIHQQTSTHQKEIQMLTRVNDPRAHIQKLLCSTMTTHCYMITQVRLEKALLQHPNPTPEEILMDNQLCDFSSTNPCGTARFMGRNR